MQFELTLRHKYICSVFVAFSINSFSLFNIYKIEKELLV